MDEETKSLKYSDMIKLQRNQKNEPDGLKTKQTYEVYCCDYNSISLGKQIYEYRNKKDIAGETICNFAEVSGVMTDLIQKSKKKFQDMSEINHFFECQK